MESQLKFLFSGFFLVIVSTWIQAQVFPVTTIFNNGNVNKSVNIVYLAEGYTAGQMNNFLADANNVNMAMFVQTPFSNYANFFNVYAIHVPSSQSGSDHPGTATDVAEPAQPVQYVNTYFNTTFDRSGIHRLLGTSDLFTVTNVLAANVPQYDISFLLVNSPYYGGSGTAGSLAVSSVEGNAPEIAFHEIGHSFANLRDEYWAGDAFALETYNMTQESNPNQVYWWEWIGDNGIGVYPHCCGGNSANWNKPHQNCKMQFLNSPFCAVCTERFIDVIYSLVTPIDNYAPANLVQEFTGPSMDFKLGVIYPNPNTLNIEWTLNGAPFDLDVETVSIVAAHLSDGANTLVAKVIDKTPLSRSYWPAEGYEFSVSWTINYDATCPSFLDIQDDPIVTGIYQAGVELSASTAIALGSVVEFLAGEQITLNPGFIVPKGMGTAFMAYIVGCSP